MSNTNQTGIPPKHDDFDIVCPHPECAEGFNTFHDESAISSLVYHLRKEHESLYSDLKAVLGGQ